MVECVLSGEWELLLMAGIYFVSPWYNLRGWLSVEHQVYLSSIPHALLTYIYTCHIRSRPGKHSSFWRVNRLSVRYFLRGIYCVVLSDSYFNLLWVLILFLNAGSHLCFSLVFIWLKCVCCTCTGVFSDILTVMVISQLVRVLYSC